RKRRYPWRAVRSARTFRRNQSRPRPQCEEDQEEELRRESQHVAEPLLVRGEEESEREQHRVERSGGSAARSRAWEVGEASVLVQIAREGEMDPRIIQREAVLTSAAHVRPHDQKHGIREAQR